MTGPGAARPARLLLITGKGGVGKTTIAAATAARCAARGLRTCVASTDSAHSLGDVLQHPVGHTPGPVADDLDAVHVEARAEMRASWGALHDYLVDMARRAGVSEVHAAELAVVPGFDEVITIASVVDIAESGRYDVVAVDCAPSAETVRLLSLPHVLGWWLEQLLPNGTELAPIAALVRNGLGVPLPTDDVLGAGRALLERLRRTELVLNDPARTSVRLVATPEQVVVTETRRTATYLSLFGYPLDGVIANRVVPELVGDSAAHRVAASGALEPWVEAQAQQLTRLRSDFEPLPVATVPWAERPVLGLHAVAQLGVRLYGETDPLEAGTPVRSLRFEHLPSPQLCVPVSGVESDEVELGRQGAELHLRMGRYHRVVALPEALSARAVRSAAVVDGELVVSFEEAG